MDTSSNPQTSFIMPDQDVIVTPSWLDNREIELSAISEVRKGSGTSVTARYKGTSEIAPIKNWYVSRCGTINNNGWFVGTEAGVGRITATAANGKTATFDITVIDRTRIGINNNTSGASLSDYEPWKGETITVDAGYRDNRYIFDGWTMSSPSDGVFADPTQCVTTFTVGRGGTITLTANWKDNIM